MNLSDFTLLKEDNDSYQVGHPKGKPMKIGKKGLSDKAHQLIQKLRREQHFEEGGEVEGTQMASVEPTDESADSTTSSSEPLDPKAAITAMDEGAIPINLDAAAPPPGLEPFAAPASSPVAQGVMPQGPATATQVPPQPMQGMGTAQKDIAAGAQAEAKAGQAQAQAYGDAADKVQALQQAFEKRIATRESQNAALWKKIQEGKIDPDRFWKNTGTGSKIASSLGMLLSGIGSGLTHTPNMALEQIQNHINADIESQKHDQGKDMNLYKMNLEAMGDDRAATLASQSQLLTFAKAKAQQAQASAVGPEAKARIAPVIMGLNNQEQQIHRMQAALDMINQPASSQKIAADPATLVSTLVPKEHQAKVFGEIQAAQDTKRMGSSIMKAFDDAARENTILKTGAGLLRTPASVGALHQAMQPTFKDLEGTVRQAAMDNTFKNITPVPGDFDSSIREKRKSLESYLQSKASAPTAKGYGIDLSRFESTDSKAKPGFSPGSVVSVKGKQYRVAQDGDSLTPI